MQAVILNQVTKGAETPVRFFVSLSPALLDQPVDPTTVFIGEMSVRGLLQPAEVSPNTWRVLQNLARNVS